jgi:NAD(P)-dependent dehydrogenase (short-subunit alcohol dehydrogenase family)
VIDTNLTGAWHTAKAAIPHMIESGGGGSIIITSSASGIHAYENRALCAVQARLGGLMRTLALGLGPHGERAKDAYRLHRLLPAPVVDHQQGVLAAAGAVHPMQPAVHAEPGLIEPSHLTPRLKETDQLQCGNPT